MEILVCDICGGKLQAKTKGIFVCTKCGVEYTTERMREKVQELSGSQFEVIQDDTENIQKEAANNNQFIVNEQISEKRLMPVSQEYQTACNIIRESNNILTLESALEILELYRDEEGCSDYIKLAAEKIRKLKIYQNNIYSEQTYQNALELMRSGKNNIRSLQKAADQFSTILGWKDASQQKSICLEKIEKIKQKKTKKRTGCIITVLVILLAVGLLIWFNAFEIRDNLTMAIDNLSMNISDTLSSMGGDSYEDEIAENIFLPVNDEDESVNQDETYIDEDVEELYPQTAYEPQNEQNTEDSGHVLNNESNEFVLKDEDNQYVDEDVKYINSQDNDQTDDSVNESTESDNNDNGNSVIYDDEVQNDDTEKVNADNSNSVAYDEDVEYGEGGQTFVDNSNPYTIENDVQRDEQSQSDEIVDENSEMFYDNDEDNEDLLYDDNEDTIIVSEDENTEESFEDESYSMIENPNRNAGTSAETTQNATDFYTEDSGASSINSQNENVDPIAVLNKTKIFSNSNGSDIIPVTIYDDSGRALITFSFEPGSKGMEILFTRVGGATALKGTDNGFRVPVAFEADIFTSATTEVTVHNKRKMNAPFCSYSPDYCMELGYLVQRNAAAGYGDRYISLFKIIDRSMIILGKLEEEAENWGFAAKRVDQFDIYGYGYHATFYGWLHLPDGLDSEGDTFYFYNY